MAQQDDNREPWEPEDYGAATFGELLTICRDVGIGDEAFRTWTSENLADASGRAKRTIDNYLAGDSKPRNEADLQSFLACLTRRDVSLYNDIHSAAQSLFGTSKMSKAIPHQTIGKSVSKAVELGVGFGRDEVSGTGPLAKFAGIKEDRIAEIMRGAAPTREELDCLIKAFGRNRVSAEWRLLRGLAKSWEKPLHQTTEASSQADTGSESKKSYSSLAKDKSHQNKKKSQLWPAITGVCAIIALVITAIQFFSPTSGSGNTSNVNGAGNIVIQQ